MSESRVLAARAISFLTASTLAVVITAFARGGNPLHVLLISAVVWLAAAAIVFAGWVVLLITERWTARADSAVEREMGPLLRDWLGLAPKDQLRLGDLRDWRHARRAGVTAREAQQWSDHGLPYALADNAKRERIGLGEVLTITDTFRRAGLWDGTNRRALNSLFRVSWESSQGPVLRWWVALPVADIEMALHQVQQSDESGYL